MFVSALALAAVALLSCAVPASAQTTDVPRVGVGLSLVQSGVGGAGVAGGLFYPFRDIGPRTLGVIGAAAFHHFGDGGFSMITFGGGVRMTHTWSATLKTFVQGVGGIVQARDSGDNPFGETRTDFGIGGGGGILYPINDQINFMAEADLGLVPGSRASAKGLLLTFGVSMPLGRR